MTRRVVFAPQALADISEIIEYVSQFSESAADRYRREIMLAIGTHIATSPRTWTYVWLTGAPFRAYLYRANARRTYWIIYDIDEARRTVNILRVWSTAFDPARFRP